VQENKVLTLLLGHLIERSRFGLGFN